MNRMGHQGTLVDTKKFQHRTGDFSVRVSSRLSARSALRFFRIYDDRRLGRASAAEPSVVADRLRRVRCQDGVARRRDWAWPVTWQTWSTSPPINTRT